jgi:subtilisin family serine protease
VEHLEDRTTPSITQFTPLLHIGSSTFAADRVIVVMNVGASAAALDDAPFAASVQPLGFDMYSIRLTPGTDPHAAIAHYNGQPGVTVAELDRIVYASGKPNDPSYGSLYGPTKVGAETVWNFATGDPNFVVGVIDSGVDYTHPDLLANIWRNPGEIAGNGVDDDDNGFVDDVHGWDFADDDNDPMDFDGHGTHVAGTVGAVGNNGIGVAGVNWAVKIMPLRFIGPFGGAISDEVAAISYSVKMGVKVTNNSYGGLGTAVSEARAVSRAQFAGQIFVVAAGNEAANNDIVGNYPTNFSTAFDNVIAVAATDSTDQLADFSNYGAATVTLAAPGVGILSTFPGGTYGLLDGTSMASPHVAGAVALYWSANPTLSATQVINRLKLSVDKLPGLAGLVSTGGRLNVAKMFNVGVVPPVVVGAPAGTEIVRVLGAGGATQLALAPHPGFLGGIVSDAGDLTGDGVADVVTAATFGGHVKAFDGATGAEFRSFYGFEGYQGPINVAIGDLTGDGVGDIIVAANLNGHVKVFDGTTGALTFSALVYDGYFGSIAVAAADTDGNGVNELLTGAEAGAGVHVKAFGAGTLALADSFFATGPGTWPTFSLSAADLDLDGSAELLVSHGPRVRVLNAQTKAVRADFLAFDPLSTDRVTVQAGQYSGDVSAELVVVRETNGLSQVSVFDGADFSLADSFFAGTR